MKNFIFVTLVLAIIGMSGCQTTKVPKNSLSKQQQTETQESLRSIAGAMKGGKPLTDEELHNLQKQVQNNPEARESVEAITNSLSGTQSRVKYCPQTGKRYAPNLIYCPQHPQELLKEVE